MTIDHLPPADPELIMAECRSLATALRESDDLMREIEHYLIGLSELDRTGLPAEVNHWLLQASEQARKINEHLGG